MVRSFSCLVALLATMPLLAAATDISTLSERERASYCSGVLGQQSLLFLQVASFHMKNGNIEKYKSSRYNSDQLLIRSKVLGVYGGNKLFQDRGYAETGEAIRKAQQQGRNPIESFYGQSTKCFEFYKSLEGTADFDKYVEKAKKAMATRSNPR